MYSNLFVTRNTPLRQVEVNYYTPVEEIPPKDYYKILRGAEAKLFRAGFSTACFQDKIVVTSDEKKLREEINVGNFSFRLAQKKFRLNPLEHNFALCELVKNSLKKRAFSLGFTGPEGQKFYAIKPYKIDFFAFHDAFFFDIEVFPDGKVGIWLDPTTRWKQGVKGFLEWAHSNGYSQSEIKSYMIGKIVKCPSIRSSKKYSAEVVDVNFKPIKDFDITVNGKKTKVYDYWTKDSPEHIRWLKRNNTVLNPEEKPVVTVQITPNLRPSFPPSLLEFVIDLDDPEIPASALREKKVLNPEDRIKNTFELYNILLKQTLYVGLIPLNFERKLFEWTSEMGRKYGRTKPLSAPSLSFGHNSVCEPPSTWADPSIKWALTKYGPVTRLDKIPISVVVPEEDEEGVQPFVGYLNKYGKKLHLGKFVLREMSTVDRLHPDRYRRTCWKLGNNVGKGVVIVVLPRKNVAEAYYSAKRGLGEQQVKSQMICLETFSEIAGWNGDDNAVKYVPIINNLAIQIYDKYLESGESIWHLAKPAGGLDPHKVIYFMGFDVSRAPEKRKEAAAYAAVCDSYGKIIYRKTIDSHKGERVQSKVLSEWFFEVAHSAFDKTDEKRKLSELILFKDGPIRSNQVVDYREGSLDAKKRLIDEGIMDMDSNIRIISAVKTGPHRIYGKRKKYNYKTHNTAIVRDRNSALIVTTEPPQGTAATLRLKIEYQIFDDMNIDQVLAIFNDLRYLDWDSLYKQPKTILPLHIVQNLAKLSKEDVTVPYIPR